MVKEDEEHQQGLLTLVMKMTRMILWAEEQELDPVTLQAIIEETSLVLVMTLLTRRMTGDVHLIRANHQEGLQVLQVLLEEMEAVEVAEIEEVEPEMAEVDQEGHLGEMQLVKITGTGRLG